MMQTETQIFALFGNPVAHSLSPLMHNAAYREMDIRAAYVPFCVNDLAGAVRGIRALGIRGASITIPFKTDIMAMLDHVDDTARTIGAVNTVLNRDGVLYGTNTDWIGLSLVLKAHFAIAGKTFSVLGAGGAARAAVYAVVKGGGTPIVVYRSEERAANLAAQFGCRMVPLREIETIEADCLINTTPVGMFPSCDDSPIECGPLSRFRWVMDTIYNPMETRLLRDARQARCKVISGLDMFVHQGAEQIKLWLNREPPRGVMRQVVTEALASHGTNMEKGQDKICP